MSDIELNGTTFYQKLGEHVLLGSRCKHCGALYAPLRQMCADCHKTDMEPVELSGKGKLAAFTIIYIAPSAMIAAGYDRKNPYCAGVVDLEEGPRISGQILGVDVCNPESIQIGTPVTVAFVERGEEGAKKVYLGFKVLEG